MRLDVTGSGLPFQAYQQQRAMPVADPAARRAEEAARQAAEEASRRAAEAREKAREAFASEQAARKAAEQADAKADKSERAADGQRAAELEAVHLDKLQQRLAAEAKSLYADEYLDYKEQQHRDLAQGHAPGESSKLTQQIKKDLADAKELADFYDKEAPHVPTPLLKPAEVQPPLLKPLNEAADRKSFLYAPMKGGYGTRANESPESYLSVFASPAWKDASSRPDVLKIGRSDLEPHTLAALLSSPATRDKDARGNTLLENVATLLSSKPHDKLEKSSFLGRDVDQDVLEHVLDPSKVNQGEAGTCSVTVAQYSLARDNPAEYVRLMAGLTGEDGRVDMAGGGTLKLQQESFTSSGMETHGRDIASTIFQGAAMEEANGYWTRYDAAEDENQMFGVKTPFAFGDDLTGLYSDMFDTANYREFGGRDLFESTAGAALQADDAYEYLKDYKRDEPVFVGLTPLGTSHWSSPKLNLEGKLHQLTFDHVDAKTGDVILRNPWGRNSAYITEDNYGHPIKDGDGDMVRLSRSEFLDQMLAVFRPDDMPPPKLA